MLLEFSFLLNDDNMNIPTSSQILAPSLAHIVASKVRLPLLTQC